MRNSGRTQTLWTLLFCISLIGPSGVAVADPGEDDREAPADLEGDWFGVLEGGACDAVDASLALTQEDSQVWGVVRVEPACTPQSVGEHVLEVRGTLEGRHLRLDDEQELVSIEILAGAEGERIEVTLHWLSVVVDQSCSMGWDCGVTCQ